LHIPFLGEIPLDTAIRQGGDQGQPIVVVHPDSPSANAFYAISDQVLMHLPLPKEER